METIEEIFSDILKFMRISEEQIRPEASFVNDFHFQDVDFICLILYINIYFKINIKEKDYVELKTVGSAIVFIKRKLNVN